MRNFWAQKEFTIAAWHGNVAPLLDRPKELLELIRAVYEIGRDTRLMVPVDVDLIAESVRRWDSEQTIDLFRMAQRAHVEAELAWYDASDNIVTGRVADLGELLALLQPNPDAISKYDRELGERPVGLTGQQIAYAQGRPSDSSQRAVTFTVALHSDIWFPYVVGFAHPSRDMKRYFDNRELAHRNSQRLNQLLARVSALLTQAGGHWHLDKDDLASPYARWLSDTGVDLDLPAPELIPESAVDVEWPTLED